MLEGTAHSAHNHRSQVPRSFDIYGAVLCVEHCGDNRSASATAEGGIVQATGTGTGRSPPKSEMGVCVCVGLGYGGCGFNYLHIDTHYRLGVAVNGMHHIVHI
jgi:hypothetical protein